MEYAIAKELEQRILDMNFHKIPGGGVSMPFVSLDLEMFVQKCCSGFEIET